jgi:hypothetical protein
MILFVKMNLKKKYNKIGKYISVDTPLKISNKYLIPNCEKL